MASDFLKALMGASKDANERGWPGSFDPVKTVGDTFHSVMSGIGGVERDIGRGMGDFQSGLQGLGHDIFGAKPPPVRYDPLSSAIPGTPKVKRSKPATKKRSRKANK